MPSDDGGRVGSGPGGGVAAEQSGHGLVLGPDGGPAIARYVDERAEELRMHDGQINGAGTAHGPSGDAPIGPVGADPEVGDDEGLAVLRQVVGRVAAAAVDAFGVVIERAGGVDETQGPGE